MDWSFGGLEPGGLGFEPELPIHPLSLGFKSESKPPIKGQVK